MSRYVLSPLAKTDIEDIWDYTAERWNIAQAEIYIRQIQAAIETISGEPEIAVACDAVRPGYRKHPVGSHVIFFRMTSNGIDIVRILHSRMDVERRL